MAWLVTEPDEFAIGFAVALTPPTSVAYVGVHVIRLTVSSSFLVID